MDEKQIESWRKVRVKGQTRYALFYGGLIWGIPAGLLAVAADILFEFIWDRSGFSVITLASLGKYLFEIGVLYFDACVLGWLMWKRYERQYLKSISPSRDRLPAPNKLLDRSAG